MKVKSSTTLASSGKKALKSGKTVTSGAGGKEEPKKKVKGSQAEVVEPAAASKEAKVKKGKAPAVVKSPLKAGKTGSSKAAKAGPVKANKTQPAGTKGSAKANADKKRKEVAFEPEDEDLNGFDSSEGGYDSSDEEGQVQADVADLPKPKRAPTKDDSTPKPGVVYLGHLPSSFPEAALRSYLSQFGPVSRLRISRSPRTGRPKGYAFVEFEHREVAEVVCETMDGYLLAGRLLKCEMTDPSQVHRRLWEGAGKSFKKNQQPRLAREKHNADKTGRQKERIVSRLVKRESLKRQKLESLGIAYDFPGYGGRPDA